MNTLNNSPQMMLGHVQTILSIKQINALVTLLICFLTSVVTYTTNDLPDMRWLIRQWIIWVDSINCIERWIGIGYFVSLWFATNQFSNTNADEWGYDIFSCVQYENNEQLNICILPWIIILKFCTTKLQILNWVVRL